MSRTKCLLLCWLIRFFISRTPRKTRLALEAVFVVFYFSCDVQETKLEKKKYIKEFNRVYG